MTQKQVKQIIEWLYENAEHDVGGFLKNPNLLAARYLEAHPQPAPHLCPKCNGQGTVAKPPYVPGDVHEWSSTSAAFVCDVCNGAKVLPIQQNPPQPAPQDLREMAENILYKHFSKIKVWIDEKVLIDGDDDVEITREPILDAMMQFASEVSAEKDKRIIALQESEMRLMHANSMQEQRIAELEEQVRQLSEPVVIYGEPLRKK